MTLDDKFQILVHRMVLLQQKCRLENRHDLADEIINILLSVGVRIRKEHSNYLEDDRFEIKE
jgi:hypothetical protein